MTNEGGLFDDLPENAPEAAPARQGEPSQEELYFPAAEENIEAEPADEEPVAAIIPDEPELMPAEELSAPATELPRAATLGATLAELRRRHQLDIDAVAEATWIKTGYLEALENDAFSELPQMVYVLAYVKKLCEFYGVSAADTESLLTELRENLSYEIPEDIDKSVVCREQDEDTRRKLRQITIGLTAGAVLLALLLILGGIVLALRLRRPAVPRDVMPSAALEEGQLLSLWEKPVLKTSRLP